MPLGSELEAVARVHLADDGQDLARPDNPRQGERLLLREERDRLIGPISAFLVREEF